jgi:hypothetical protein
LGDSTRRNFLFGQMTLNLFKYGQVKDYTLESLRKHTIHFKCPNDYNDPFDCRLKLVIDGTNEEWKQYGQRLGLADDQIEEIKKKETITIENSGSFIKETQHHALLTTRISCFSEVPDSILMWSHYADSHKGICLLFETTKHDTIQYLVFEKDDLNYANPILPPDHGGILKVRYSDNLPAAYNHVEYDKNQLVPFLITKSPDWAYEKEWRLLLPDNALSTNNPRYKPEQLKGIIFGMNCTKEHKKEIGDILKGSVKYYEAFAAKDAYKLEIREIKNYA